jgi:hypothetical protein
MVGFVRSILTNLGNIVGCDAAADLCKNPQCDKDPRFCFCVGTTRKKKTASQKNFTDFQENKGRGTTEREGRRWEKAIGVGDPYARSPLFSRKPRMTHAIPWTSRNGIRKNIPASTTRKTHPQGAPTSAKPLETAITKVIHAMLPIDPSSTASLRTPLEAFIPGQTLSPAAFNAPSP